MAHSLSDRLIALLAGRRGHFQMESGLHSELWFDLDRLFARPEILRPFVVELARRCAVHRVDAICGPRVGGAKLAAAIGQELGIESFHTERFEVAAAVGLFPVQYRLPAAQRARVAGRAMAIVDDAISAGSAVRGTFGDLVAGGARPVVLGALFVFGERAGQFAADCRVALEAVANVDYRLWLPEECPLCRAGIPCEKISDVTPPTRSQ